MPGMTLKECDESFEKSTFDNIGLLIKIKNLYLMRIENCIRILCPFNKEEYFKKREEIGVPKDLL